MMEVAHQPEVMKGPNKRRLGHKKGGKGKKKPKVFQGSGEKVKIDRKMKKLFRKRARDYHSDDDDDEVDELGPVVREEKRFSMDNKKVVEEKSYEEEEDEDEDDDGMDEEAEEEHGGSENEDDEILPGITKFTEGCRAFRTAFKKIVKMSVSEDSLGPVLSGHKKLVAEKLAEEESERKVKGEAKKEKHLIREKGHVKPANYLDSHEKFLIGVATKGVVKLFNAVNKAQIAQKGLDPSSFKDAKAIRKRRKVAFFSELNKPSSDISGQGHTSAGTVDGEGPAWAPLRDNYMLTNPKLKDWDKMQATSTVEDDNERMPGDSSSDDD